MGRRINKFLLSITIVIIVIIAVNKIWDYGSSTSKTRESRWKNRSLKKGEPSGAETRRRKSPGTYSGATVTYSGESGAANGAGTGLNSEGRKPPRERFKGQERASQKGQERGSQKVKISVTARSREADSDTTFTANLEKYRSRKLLISETCRKYGLGFFHQQKNSLEGDEYRRMQRIFPWPPEKSLMYQKNWHLLYCWIHKVASSSWSQVFFNLAGIMVSPSRLHEATVKFSPSSTELVPAMTNSLVFTVVRHPFERLVSAYRDKFELSSKYAYVFSMYTPKIKAVARHSPVTPKRPTLVNPGPARPTFIEFVDYLLVTPVSEYNDHWVPYWLHCHLCDIEYDVVGKIETMEEDMQIITGISGLSATNISLPWANRKNSGKEVSLSYFKEIGLDRLTRLYNIYKIDFEMFNYDIQPYMDLYSEQSP